ncbi:MAG: hypothetical protein ABIV23_03370, partial [Sphingomicrobium sp.]
MKWAVGGNSGGLFRRGISSSHLARLVATGRNATPSTRLKWQDKKRGEDVMMDQQHDRDQDLDDTPQAMGQQQQTGQRFDQSRPGEADTPDRKSDESTSAQRSG